MQGEHNARETCMAKVKRLDSLFEENGVPHLIKIDVEGYEEDVIASAGEKFLDSGIIVIIAELNDKALISWMRECGFRMYEYEPFTRMLTQVETKEGGNGIFIRDIELARRRVQSAKPFVVNGIRI